MDSFVLGVQLLLAVVFATAGVAKLLDQPGSRSALEGFGVPTRVVPVAAWLLPLVELATAVALVVHPTARAGAIAALVLLLAFIGGIASAMSRGEAPDCHCFGQLHSAPAGRGTLVRNAALSGLAAIVAVHGPARRSTPGWMRAPPRSWWLLERASWRPCWRASACGFGWTIGASVTILPASGKRLRSFRPGFLWAPRRPPSNSPTYVARAARSARCWRAACRSRCIFMGPSCGALRFTAP